MERVGTLNFKPDWFCMSVFSFIASIKQKAFPDATARLDTFFEHLVAKNAKEAKKSKLRKRYSWIRKVRALIVFEEVTITNGGLTRRESARFDFDHGLWHLYRMDASRRWRRYILAPENESFDQVFRHWVADETGIFKG